MAYEIKTKETDIGVSTFIDTVVEEKRRDDARRLVEIFEDITGDPAKMWGPTIIGFGQYQYKYDSGHEGDMCRAGFSPRKANIVLYLNAGYEDAAIEKKNAELRAKLGKHKTGKSCLYINKLADVDLDVLTEMIQLSQTYMDETYPR